MESGFLIQERKDEQLRKVVHYLSVSEVRLNHLDMCLQSASHYQVSHRLYGRRYMLVYLVALANLVAQVSFIGILLVADPYHVGIHHAWHP